MGGNLVFLTDFILFIILKKIDLELPPKIKCIKYKIQSIKLKTFKALFQKPKYKIQNIKMMNIILNKTNAKFDCDTRITPLCDLKSFRQKKNMECYVEAYRYKNGLLNEELKNNQIVKLAKKYDFYWKTIQGIIDPSKSFGIRFPNQRTQNIATARIDNKIVGFVIYSLPSWSGTYWLSSSIDYWLVDEKYRGFGIGQALFEVYLDGHKECGGMNRWVNFKRGDEKMEALYTKLGYKEIQTYGGKTQDTMKMDLSEQQCKGHHKWWNIEYDCILRMLRTMCYPCEATPYNNYRDYAVYSFIDGKEDPSQHKDNCYKVGFVWFNKFAEVLADLKTKI